MARLPRLKPACQALITGIEENLQIVLKVKNPDLVWIYCESGRTLYKVLLLTTFWHPNMVAPILRWLESMENRAEYKKVVRRGLILVSYHNQTKKCLQELLAGVN